MKQAPVNNGAINYSRTIVFDMGNTPSFNIYPRLITGNTLLSRTYPGATSTGSIRVVGIDGKVWWTRSIPAGSTQTSIVFAPLARGSYFVVCSGNGSLAATQVFKE